MKHAETSGGGGGSVPVQAIARLAKRQLIDLRDGSAYLELTVVIWPAGLQPR